MLFYMFVIACQTCMVRQWVQAGQYGRQLCSQRWQPCVDSVTYFLICQQALEVTAGPMCVKNQCSTACLQMASADWLVYILHINYLWRVIITHEQA